jgi:hypothetical protein
MLQESLMKSERNISKSEENLPPKYGMFWLNHFDFSQKKTKIIGITPAMRSS